MIDIQQQQRQRIAALEQHLDQVRLREAKYRAALEAISARNEQADYEPGERYAAALDDIQDITREALK